MLTVVGLIAALSAGVITTDAQPAFRVRAAPSAQRFGPETFYGNVVTGTVTTIAGVTQFVVDRPKKVGLEIDPTQRETITCKLENVPPDQAALVAPGQQLYFYGTYDFVQGIFFVNIVGTTPESVAVAAAPTSADNGSDDLDNDGDADNGGDSDNDSDDSDNGDENSDNDSDDSDNDDEDSDNDEDDSDNDEDDSDNDEDDSDNDEDNSDNDDDDDENDDDDSDNDEDDEDNDDDDDNDD
jgi:hypothetical protein